MKDVTYLLQNQIPVVDSHTTVATLLKYIEKNNFSHFPIVEDELWIGNIAKEDLILETNNTLLGELKMNFQYFSTEKSTYWALLWENFMHNNSNIIPAIDKNRKLLGIYRKEDVLGFWDNIPSFIEKGTTIVIQKSSIEYSFSQICQIIESNNAKLLSIFIISFENNFCNILVKTNGLNNTEIIQDLRRFDYEIISKHLEDSFQNKISDNSEYLQKYLNI
ncbi:CBS domain-containing protein [Myroides guanonis]|uniref:CBS domain-containing protein n=1 Tax=Myroides guanonis TaxID=1150112 RepID=A0A1I3NT19_9FLAO|nr:CBS domain-containing protein [Myroides guanonis]SFJ12277.1 CBS domain-containing protein [Myroides guanonis]